MDIEAQILLADIRMDGVAFEIARLRPPFCVGTAKGPISYCYLLRKGVLWLEVDTPAPAVVKLEPGTIVGLTGLFPHRFKSAARLRIMAEQELVAEALSAPASDAPVELIVGHIQQEALAFSGLFNGPMIIAPAKAEKITRRIWRAFEQVEDELSDKEPIGGTSAVVRRLAELMLLNIVRWAISEATTEEAGGMRALVDIRILRAMAAYSRDPLRNWTVKELADIAGMSRTAFSERFHALIGASPLQSVTQMRLRLAATALARGDQSVEEVAAMAGYSSAAAFIRAFQREFQVTPAKWRANPRPISAA